MEVPYRSGLMWFRRDLRVQDNAALAAALRSCAQVHAAFVFDTAILARLPRRDRRVEFIRACAAALDQALSDAAGTPAAGLITRHGDARQEIVRLAVQLGVQAVFASHDDEPAALLRDRAVREALAAAGIALHTCKDHVVFERGEVRTQAGTPYAVFTPYKKAWLQRLQPADCASQDSLAHCRRLAPRPDPLAAPVPGLAELGFEAAGLTPPLAQAGEAGARDAFADFQQRMDDYAQARDFPGVKGPSYLSVHLRFGTISVRELVRHTWQRASQGSAGAQAWLSELVWREFYVQVLANFPHVVDADGNSHSFKPAFDAIQWEDGPHAQALFAAWCEGRTGYPLVDAAMCQLNQTGYMHNRLRMVTASFLCKDLGLDWRWGERYFAEKLNDFDLAANNGGWQWASSSGCDAQPWFRIFNPVTQSRKFDPGGRFIRRYLPQLARLPDDLLHAPWTARPVDLSAAGITLGVDYPAPVVDHEKARQRTLARYAVVRPGPPPQAETAALQ